MGHSIGIDIGGGTIKGGIVDDAGHVIRPEVRATPVDNLPLLITTLVDMINAFLPMQEIRGAGIGVPGLLDSRTQTIQTSPNIPCLKGVNLRLALSSQVALPIVVENDANAGACGEFLSGAAKGSRPLIYLTLGTGLGGGLIFDGRIFHGSSGYAGEAGHVTIDPTGRPCACGSRGCLETYVSSAGILETAREISSSLAVHDTVESLHHAAIDEKGHAVAFAWFTATQHIEQVQVDRVKRMAGEHHWVVVFHRKALHLHAVDDGTRFGVVVEFGRLVFAGLGVVVDVVHDGYREKSKKISEAQPWLHQKCVAKRCP